MTRFAFALEMIFVGDQTRNCRNCGSAFQFTEGEQAFYLERGYRPPAYCPHCRDARRATAKESDLVQRSVSRPQFGAVCSKCGVLTQVPFQPRPGRSVLCPDCYSRKRSAR